MNPLSKDTKTQNQMWQVAINQSLILLVCAATLALIFRTSIPEVAGSFLTMTVSGALTFLLLFHFRKQKPVLLANWCYVFNVLVSGLGVVYNHQIWVNLNQPFTPFFGFKIILIIVALQAPVVQWVGWSTLLFLFSAPIVQFLTWTDEQRLILSVQEPWFTSTVAIACGFIYFQRLRIIEMVRKEAQLEEAADQLRRFAHLLLGTQHLMNTPMQVIESGVDLIRIKNPEIEPIVKTIEKSLGPIRRISRLMSFGRQHLQWENVSLALTIEELEAEIQKIAPNVNLEQIREGHT